MKGNEQIEALQKIEELLNKVPTTANRVQPKATADSRQLTITEMSRPPQEPQQTPRVNNKTPSPREVMPRLSTTRATINKPMPDKTPPLSAKEHSTANIKLRHLIRAAPNCRARIPQHHQMTLPQQDHIASTQLPHDPETGKVQTYCQLLKDLKYKVVWSKSASNEIGRLSQGVGG
jgi:hypothetical protein